MLEAIPNIIARKHGLELSGASKEIIMQDGIVKVRWSVGDGEGGLEFQFYSNGTWDLENYETGEYIEGHTNPPTQRIWIKRLTKIYWPEYAYAAWFEWKSLMSEARQKENR